MDFCIYLIYFDFLLEESRNKDQKKLMIHEFFFALLQFELKKTEKAQKLGPNETQ